MGIFQIFYFIKKVAGLFSGDSKRDYGQDFSHDFEAKMKEKGEKYEKQIGYMLQKKGYKVIFNGINMGKADKGIDLVAHKGDTTLLIQCKNWENTQVKQEQLRIFIGDCTSYIDKNQRYLRKRKVRRIFVTSCPKKDYGVEKFLEENKSVEYQIVPYNR